MVIVRKEIIMIINENNKDMILKGMVKRGFNQDPNELRAKLHPNAGKINKPNTPEPPTQVKKTIADNSLKETFNVLRRLK